MIYCRIIDGKFSERGFLYGPYCPIYGFGGIIIITLLQPFSSNFILLFLFSMLLTSLLEYVTSYIMEKIFDAKWWDYSDKFLNINGRVCLRNSLLFGILGLVIMYIVHPHIITLISSIPTEYLSHIVYLLIIVMCIDLTATVSSLLNLKEKLKEIQNFGETLKEKTISKKFNLDSKEIKDQLKSSLIFTKLTDKPKRIMKAFPNLKFSKLNSAYSELMEYYQKLLDEKHEKKEKEKELKK